MLETLYTFLCNYLWIYKPFKIERKKNYTIIYIELPFHSDASICELLCYSYWIIIKCLYYVLVICQMPIISQLIFPTNIISCYIRNYLKIKMFLYKNNLSCFLCSHIYKHGSCHELFYFKTNSHFGASIFPLKRKVIIILRSCLSLFRLL